MTIVSASVFLWLIGATLIIWLLPKKISHIGVLLVGFCFLAFYAPVSLGILALTGLVSYFGAKQQISRFFIVGSIICIGVMLVWYKIAKIGNEAVDNPLISGAMPLGLSYYTFKQIHYLFEKMKGRLPEHNIADYLCYLFFLPTLMAGPINLFSDFKRDQTRRRFDKQNLSLGIERVVYGYAKIVILGNYFVSFVLKKYLFEIQDNYPSLSEYLDCIRQAANLYFQFSGYSDIAIGFSLAMGYRILENFNYPFLAVNINEFWNRWHISLSNWCRLYVYTPVASITRQPYIGIIASMIVFGLWHDISWNYLLWGLYHGIGISVWQLFRRFKKNSSKKRHQYHQLLIDSFCIFLTLNFFVLSFVFTKETNLTATVSAVGRLLGLAF